MSAPFKEIRARFTPDQESFAVVETHTMVRNGESQPVTLLINRYGSITVHFETYADWPRGVVHSGQITAFDAHTSARIDSPIARFLIPTLAYDMALQLADEAREEPVTV
jgi:hypothetical protein